MENENEEIITYDIDKKSAEDLPKTTQKENLKYEFTGLDSARYDDGQATFNLEAMLTEAKMATLDAPVVYSDDVDLNFWWEEPFHINTTKEKYDAITYRPDKVYFLMDQPPLTAAATYTTIEDTSYINEAINVIQRANKFLKSQSK